MYVNSSGGQQVMPCQQWVYHSPTAVTEFDLVCDRTWLRPWPQVIVMSGELFASITLSTAADMFGRKRVFMLAITGVVFFSFALAFAPIYIVFLALRLVFGIVNTCVFMIGIPLSMEFIGPSKRVIVYTIQGQAWVLGCFLLSWVAYMVPNWKSLQLVSSAPGLLLLLLWRLIPESPRWLISVGRKDEARKIIRHIANVNKTEVPSNLDKLMVEGKEKTSEKEVKLMDIIESKVIRMRLIISMFILFAHSFTYYGLSLNAGNLVGGVHLNFFLMSLMEAPAVLVVLLVDKLGRKPLVIGPMLVGGAGMITAVFIPEDYHIIITGLALLGKFCISISYSVIYLLVCEIFPTGIRSRSIGLVSVGSRIGAIVAPFVEILGTKWRPGPTLVFGIISVVGGILTIPLPESKGLDLPESIQDGENVGKKPTYVPVVREEGEPLENLKQDAI